MAQENNDKLLTISREEIVSGQYFEAARAWYAETCLMPISQRNWMLVVAVIGCFSAVVAFISLMDILPVIERPSVPVAVRNGDDNVAQSVPLKVEGQGADATILNFFVTEYVKRREEYSWHHYDKNMLFVRAHSDPLTYKTYAQAYGMDNPESPAARLGERGERDISIISAQVNRTVQPPVASVQFQATLHTAKGFSTSRFTASFAFYYDSLKVEQIKDPDSGEVSLRTEDPVFNVVQYVVTQSK